MGSIIHIKFKRGKSLTKKELKPKETSRTFNGQESLDPNIETISRITGQYGKESVYLHLYHMAALNVGFPVELREPGESYLTRDGQILEVSEGNQAVVVTVNQEDKLPKFWEEFHKLKEKAKNATITQSNPQ